MPSDCPMHSNKMSIFFFKNFKWICVKNFFIILNLLFLFLFLAEIATTLIFFPVFISISFFNNLVHCINKFQPDLNQL